jgi:drug/metabolite transporter (DMT)-like permease
MTTTVVSSKRLDRGRNLDPGVVFAFLAIYLIWGTTFFAIRIAVSEIPPLFAAGVRMFLAGVILLAFMWMRGAERPTRLQWRNLALMGSLMFVIDYGALFWAERYIPSGIAAVLSATVPLMTIAFEIFIFRLQPFRWTLIAAVLLGFAGVGVLLLPDPRQSLPVVPCVVVLLGTAAWCLGTVLSRRLVLPDSRPVAAGGSMMIGGAVLLIVSALFGELHPWPHASARAVVALAYLILFGSVLAFTAYVWLLGRMPASTVASYAYVNPVVAVALGYFAAGEPLTAHVVAGAALVLVSVYMILRRGRRRTAA